LRLALALLFVTGIRISELLPLKMNQVESLFTNHWISIDRPKRGPANHKAFLTKEGSRIMRERRSDFELMQLFKKSDSYIFTAENSNKPLAREAFTNLINKFIKDCSRRIDRNPNLSSHSFRVGFIRQLWRDTSDIEFVRQALGHAKIDTTSQYLENLSEKERQARMLEINVDKVKSEG
jgi:site-specific recombinase XerD